MPPRRLPNLPLPREPLVAGRRVLTPSETAHRDQLLTELRTARDRELEAQRDALAAVTAALEGRATLRQVADVLGTSEAAMGLWLMRSRRRAGAAS
jgi:hypothetical protein